MLPPAPFSMYTPSATFSDVTSTLLKSCWAKAAPAARTSPAAQRTSTRATPHVRLLSLRADHTRERAPRGRGVASPRTLLLKCQDERSEERRRVSGPVCRPRRGPHAAPVPRAAPPPPHRGEGAPPAAPGAALEVVLRDGTGGDRRRRRLRPRGRRLDPAHAPQPGRVHHARGGPGPPVPPALRQGRRLHQGPRPHLPLRPAREADRRDDQPPRRDAARWRTASPWPPSSAASAGWPPPSAGDGGTSEGDFHEAVNLAAVWKLPVLFVIENNQYGLSTPVVRAVRLRGPRRPRHRVRHARARWSTATTCWRWWRRWAGPPRAPARGEGPTLLEFKTFRMRGHEEASGTAYVPPQLFEEWARKDPRRALRAMARRARAPRRRDARRSCGPRSSR